MLITPVRTFAAAQQMRAIRNGVAPYMTQNRQQIGWLRQAWWFWRVYAPALKAGTMKAWLLWAGEFPVGYGLMRSHQGRWWVTGGLVPHARGQGYGRMLFTKLTQAATYKAGEAWLEVRMDNLRARRLYEWLGYQDVSTKGDIVTMRHAGWKAEVVRESA